jgi:hypothetical protein
METKINKANNVLWSVLGVENMSQHGNAGTRGMNAWLISLPVK